LPLSYRANDAAFGFTLPVHVNVGLKGAEFFVHLVRTVKSGEECNSKESILA